MRCGLTMLMAFGIFTACKQGDVQTKPASTPPAKVENRVKESDLTRVTLSPEGEKRLGLETSAVRDRTVSKRLTIAGEVVPIPGNFVNPFEGIRRVSRKP